MHLRPLACGEVGADAILLHWLTLDPVGELRRCTSMMAPDLLRVVSMPFVLVADHDQVIDASHEATVTFWRRMPIDLAIVAALRVMLQT